VHLEAPDVTQRGWLLTLVVFVTLGVKGFPAVLQCLYSVHRLSTPVPNSWISLPATGMNSWTSPL